MSAWVGGAWDRTIGRALDEAGTLAAYTFEGVRGTRQVRHWWPDFVRECWFLVSVTALPVFLISIPLGATISLQVGDLARQLGAQSATGAVIVVAVVREVSPIATAVLIAGAGGSAMSADMGARRIREELDAMAVLGVDPVHRLVAPRLWASALVGTLLVSLVILSGASGGFVFNVLVQGVTPGAYFSGATSLLQLTDLLQALFKAGVFGFIAGVVACTRGMTCEFGPLGVGRAVNRAVVQTFVLVFAANYVISTLYLTLVPARL
jgi:phospholipid/cholesterol/gamma-HCH transport system permease protein